MALSCTEPPEGHARWTLRLLTDRSVELGYVEPISHVAVGNVLKRGPSACSTYHVCNFSVNSYGRY